MPERWQPSSDAFVPGLELSRRFFVEAVRPVLDTAFPGLAYDAAVLGSGSEVLGFDTPLSMDHHWGPRVTLFLTEADCDHYAAGIDAAMRDHLPRTFAGFPTTFAPIPGERGTLMFVADDAGPVRHRVTVTTVRRFVRDELAYDWQPDAPPTPADWLTFTEQKLRTLTTGAVYHGGLGEVASMRAQLAYYPRDIWLYVMAASWQRIGQEEPFVGRTGDVGDELGSAVIAARLVRDLMRLCFAIERQYTPYSKWFGTAFSRLDCAPVLTPHFQQALAAADWRSREAALVDAYEIVAGLHNRLAVTEPMSTAVSYFHQRPYRVIGGERFAGALVAAIQDETVRTLAAHTLIGAVDQFSDSTDLLSNPALQAALAAIYLTES